MQDFKKLNVWQKAHDLAIDVYRMTGTFPSTEVYGLTSQMRRCGISIPANIAEGCGRNGAAELGRFLQISMGSASELEYHLLLARDLKYINEINYASLDAQACEVKRMITALIQKLKTKKLITENWRIT